MFHSRVRAVKRRRVVRILQSENLSGGRRCFLGTYSYGGVKSHCMRVTIMPKIFDIAATNARISNGNNQLGMAEKNCKNRKKK